MSSKCVCVWGVLTLRHVSFSYRGPPRDKLEMRRIRALKNVQLESTELEAQFYVEVQKLEAKYLALNQPLFEKRRDIINGSHEPTDEEAHWSGDEDDNDENVVIEGESWLWVLGYTFFWSLKAYLEIFYGCC